MSDEPTKHPWRELPFLLIGAGFLAVGIVGSVRGSLPAGAFVVAAGGSVTAAAFRRLVLRIPFGRTDVLLVAVLFASIGLIGVEGARSGNGFGRGLSIVGAVVCLTFGALFTWGWWQLRATTGRRA